MHDDLRERQHRPLLIVLSGPSGVGKDSVLQNMKARNLPFHFVVTATTRPKRPNEVDGVDYFFINQDRFTKMIEQDELLEHAIVYGDHKGIPKQQVRQALASGKDVVMRIDVQGAKTIRNICPEAVLIFLSTHTEEELVERLKTRKTETPESLELRLATVRHEMESVEQFDYYVLNADSQLDATVDAILAIIRAEHQRTHPRQVVL
ncbi:MAG: guanylate kinase [Anaerolineales bacterium]